MEKSAKRVNSYLKMVLWMAGGGALGAIIGGRQRIPKWRYTWRFSKSDRLAEREYDCNTWNFTGNFFDPQHFLLYKNRRNCADVKGK